MGPSKIKYITHLNRLALILGLNIVYEYSDEENDDGGIPNVTYLEEQDTATFAWLPSMYLENNLKEYIDMADKKLEDNEDIDIIVEQVIEEARNFYLSL